MPQQGITLLLHTHKDTLGQREEDSWDLLATSLDTDSVRE